MSTIHQGVLINDDNRPYGLTQRQILELMKPINPDHVESKQGKAYIKQHQARAELTRIFGVGNWDTEVVEMTLLYETQLVAGHPQFPKKGTAPEYWVACYRAAVRLNIRDYWGHPIASFMEYHAEENAPLPNRGEAHAMAVTSVESYAFRRAAIGLGDRLGLGLYDAGSMAPLVYRTLQLDDPESPTVFHPQQPPVTVQPGAVQINQPDPSALPPAGHVMSHTEASQPVAKPGIQRTKEMDRFREVQQQMQADREAAKAGPSAMDRLQDGLKVDGQPDA